MRRAVALLFAVVALSGLLLLAGNETFVWVDERGVTHLSNDPQAVPHEGRGADLAASELDGLWEGPLSDAPPVAAATDRDEARTRRLLEGAVDDLRRGENARAAVALESILRERPTRPEPHWYLALLDRYRGRYDASEAHLRAFLAASGDGFEAWRASALRRLGELEDERRVSDAREGSDPREWVPRDGTHFRLALDPALASSSPDFADTVMRYLDQARETVEQRLDAAPSEPMGVVLYGRGAYERAHAERFSFRTVGFFDGRMHVVSAAHPAGELRALLFHEYVHAVFRERTGGDHPYWLNEGLAELAERHSRSQPRLTRSERSLLNRRLEAREWLPLRRLAPSFSGLDDEDARAAYLEAAAAAAWIEDHTDRAARGRLLERIGAGRTDDEALFEVLGLDTDAIDAAVQREIASEFASGAAPAKPGERPVAKPSEDRG